MELTLPLAKMKVTDKIRALEEIWDDLCHSVKDLPAPSWHEDVLRAREKRIKNNSSRFMDWSEAKRKIRNRIK